MAAAALLAAPAAAQTASVLRGAGHLAAATGVPPIVAPPDPTAPLTTPAMNSASARALLNQAKAASSISMAVQAQTAARASAAGLEPPVPDGLGVGGLNPVANPLLAANDPTGLSTWQGANLPTQTVSNGQTNVTVDQTQALAVLDWTTFNIGQHTTLTFNQSLNGTAEPSWIALNRVVGQINPLTGLRDPGTAPAPSQILGQIKAQGEVFVLNANGVIFGGTSQINTYSLVATSLDIGRALTQTSNNAPMTIQQRNEAFLTYGLLGYAEQAPINNQPSAYTFSAEAVSTSQNDPTLEGAVTIQAGAQITSASSGFLIFAAPKVVNQGQLTSADGEVALLAGRQVLLQASDGSANAINPNIRGLAASVFDQTAGDHDYVENAAGAVIQANDGAILMLGGATGAVINQGVLASTTSISRNGYVQLNGLDIQLAGSGLISITPDDSAGSIPQDPTSLATFKNSQVDIGDAFSRIELQTGSLIYAPSANVNIGAAAGPSTVDSTLSPGSSRIFIDSGATIDVAGLTNVIIPASRNSITIDPVTLNELANSPDYRNSFLNGATVYVDPRLSGVDSNGVAWVGSPLIPASSFAQQVGVSASELMTKGGNVALGVASYTGGGAANAPAPDVVVKAGATIDISGGWVTYQAGWVKTTRLIDAGGAIVNISNASPDDTFIGIYNGYNALEAKWGVSQSYGDPIQTGATYEAAYVEGRDAGSLTIKSSALALDGTVYAAAYAGPQQLAGGVAGSARSTLFGDGRRLQGAPSQLPSGGFLSIQAIGIDQSGNQTGGADVEVTSGATGTNLSGLTYGQSVFIDSTGTLVVPTRDPASLLPIDRLDTILLSAPALSAMGLSDVSLETSGALTIDSGANLSLAANGEFDAVSGRALMVNGSVTTASGRINLVTAQLGGGSVFNPTAPVVGSFDITVNGTLSTRGLWVNDFGASGGGEQGSAYLNGGSITLAAAPSVAQVSQTGSANGAAVNTDFSGSILINAPARIDVSGGGYVSPSGGLTLTSRGGNVSLLEDTAYFQLNLDPADPPGAIPGFRVTDIVTSFGGAVVPVNPNQINASVYIAAGTILADGFAGGGTFTLTTPQFQLAPAGSPLLAGPTTGTVLPDDFFSRTGFANYAISSYKTDLVANNFNNNLGGYNAVLQTQIVEVAEGERIDLAQSRFLPYVDQQQTTDLLDLATGGDLYSVLKPGIPSDAWDQLPVNLTLGGLIELRVDQGGVVRGAPGAGLTVSQLYNAGTIYLPGGSLTQSEVLPALYTSPNAVAVASLSDVFSTDSAGLFDEKAPNALGLIGANGAVLTNAQVAAQNPIYLLGDLGPGVGVMLAPGSVTNLSGLAVVNPRAKIIGENLSGPIVDGQVFSGGVIQTSASSNTGQALFPTPLGVSVYSTEDPTTVVLGGLFEATGATIDIAGASATFVRQDASGLIAPTREWSDGGAITLSGGALIQGSTIRAEGGAPRALGGTLTIPNLVLTQSDLTTAAVNTLSADLIQSSGFSTLVDRGSLSTIGDVTLTLPNAFILTTGEYSGLNGQSLNSAPTRDQLAPLISAAGNLTINAGYIAFDSAFQSVSTPYVGAAAGYTATFNADAIDITGAVRFDASLANVDLNARGDLRLIGAVPWQQSFNIGANTVPNSLAGQLTVQGDLTLTAAQVYPTTGTSFTLSSTATAGVITFAKSEGSTASAPYSAGGSLLVQASDIIQGGVLRAPLGSLTLGSNAALSLNNGAGPVQFAPATLTLDLTSGSDTSVSADGLIIPYGTTTDQTEWYFSPTNSNPLSAPPAGVLKLLGQGVTVEASAKVDVSGGGDVYAYEFIPGTGGSHDVLSQFSADPFTSNAGYQYPDHRQVYAIVPGLSSASAAAFDPIYASNYGNLYSSAGVGSRVYLNGGPGIAPGWYTLLPAQYAMLPGGMRVVEVTGASPPVGSQVLADGTVVTSGQFGVAGANSVESTLVTFQVQSQSVFEKYSNIALTSGDAAFAAKAAQSGVATPQLPIDAGQLVLAPLTSLSILSPIDTTPGAGGRGALIDVSGSNIDIVGASGVGSVPGSIVLTADELTRLDASSLLIGGIRTQNSDGTTSIDVTASQITVENTTADPLSAPEVLLAVDGAGASITVAQNADITAQGSLGSGAGAGAYVINGSTSGMTGQGAFLRVANGPIRVVSRINQNAQVAQGLLTISGGATLDGTSVLLDSSGQVSLDPGVKLTAANLGIDAASIAFADTATGAGLTITPQLSATFANLATLSLSSPTTISFDPGSYAFGNVSLNTPGLALGPGATTTGPVDITATSLTFSNSYAPGAACVAAACGTGDIAISAQQIVFGSGQLSTVGFGRSVSLSASSGIFVEGAGGLNVGDAALAIQTPFLGDEATPSAVGATTSAQASLTLATTGAVTITNPGGAAAGAIAGTPGASLTIDGGSISVTGAELRATAGALTLKSATGVDIGAGAILATPGYVKSFGDAADPYSVAAPGGILSLVAAGGDINVASGATLSIGGGSGAAGELSLAASGAVLMNGAIDASAPGGNASLTLDSGASLNLTSFLNSWGGAFTGDVAIRTAAGDLTLGAGQTIKATNVSLTADGGQVDIAGTIDVSGVNGGNVGLFGGQGVTLANGSRINATASGYAATDTRQAHGGNVAIGVEGSGVISVASGAQIDVSALRSDARFVPLASGAAGAFTFVPADQGGTVSFRAPVIDLAGGGESVNIDYAGSIRGASAVTVDAYKAFDLGVIAASGAYVGVTQTAPGVITLDTTATGAAPNFLADNAAGTVVNYVQSFDLSAANTRLGGLTKLSGFSEEAGIELDYSGSVVLASNWNLGAGVVDVAGAVKAGLMAQIPNQPGKYYVLPGDEGAVFSQFTKMTYRAGGAVDGAPGVLSIRAGGDLTLNGSITDGFFTFADQTDPTYLDLNAGGGHAVYQGYLSPSCFVSGCTDVGAYTGQGGPTDYVSLSLPSANTLQASLINPIPYDAVANTPGALGSLSGGTGDPIGSAELFPLISGANGAHIAGSWSYQLVGGAAASANPLQTTVGATGQVIVQGLHPYQYVATSAVSTLGGGLDLAAGGQIVTPGAWLSAIEQADPTLGNNAYTILDLFAAPAAVRAAVSQDLVNFFGGVSTTEYKFEGSSAAPTGVATTLQLAAAFLASPDFNFSALSGAYKPPSTRPSLGVVNAIAPTLIRTGTGSIAIAAAGNIDLRNGATPTLLSSNGNPSPFGNQVGGVAIYTAGHMADMSSSQVVDSATGAAVVVDPSVGSGNLLADPGALHYGYGAGSGFSSILIANPVYATGGGDISLSAGGGVLGRRDVWLESRLGIDGGGAALGFGWIGNGDQAWRTGVVGTATNLQIDPQLFQEGVGALAGGDISIVAAGNVSDLSIISTTSVATAAISSASPGLNGKALITLGGGDISVLAGGSLLGGRIDVGSGEATVVAGQSIAPIGTVPDFNLFGVTLPNALVLRLTDATVSLSAGGSVELQGITALGVRGADSSVQANLDSMGFYSANAGVSIVADGSVAIDNAGLNMLTQNTPANAAVSTAVYPGSLEAVSLDGNLSIATPNFFGTANAVVLYPSPTGTLTLAAAGQIGPATISMDDSDPSQLPGAFSNFTADTTGAFSGHGFEFPNIQPNTTATVLTSLHASTPTHEGDPTPNRIYAGGDITNMILSTPKQTRIGAGLDIINMVFVGQNLAASDVTRIVAGRDITATTVLARPVISNTNTLGPNLPTLQGDTFEIGGPGSFFLEAGRNAGPFLNSALTNGFLDNAGQFVAQGPATYGGGILSVGNEMNPWLPQQGADIYTMFGVSKGEDFGALIQNYLNPANLASMPDYLFVQTKDAAGLSVADRSQPIYGPVLVSWMQANAADALIAAYGTTTGITFQQAYNVFVTLPALRQETFILKDVYFNELAQTSIPTSVSYLQYSRGYTAVNTLFPASDGYTQNDLSGGSNGANSTVITGNLDLRLSTIQTDQGGDIFILGPGGRVLAGSTVATATQAAQRAYEGGLLLSGRALYAGSALGVPLPAAITAIPAGDEGILTLRGGGIFTFTDGSFLLNQSRLFTEDGGNIVMWSSNADLNAGEGQKTTADVPPVVVTIDQNGYSQVNQNAAVSGAGIGAFLSDPTQTPPNVYLIAPRGTVDAGAAGIRVAGDIFIAANSVANATNIQVGGSSSGIPVSSGINVGVQTSAGATAAAQAQAAQAAANANGSNASPSIITVTPVGAASDTCPPDDKTCKP